MNYQFTRPRGHLWRPAWTQGWTGLGLDRVGLALSVRCLIELDHCLCFQTNVVVCSFDEGRRPSEKVLTSRAMKAVGRMKLNRRVDRPILKTEFPRHRALALQNPKAPTLDHKLHVQPITSTTILPSPPESPLLVDPSSSIQH